MRMQSSFHSRLQGLSPKQEQIYHVGECSNTTGKNPRAPCTEDKERYRIVNTFNLILRIIVILLKR